jgi:integrative and conjugative element protein (TIGR02256 family)
MITNVIIRPQAKEGLIREIVKISNLETGGVLAGFYSNDTLIVDSVSGPGPNAHHEVDEFIIDKEHMDLYLDQQYRDSVGRNIYIGEWHTHPQEIPIPSEQDLVSIAERTFEWSHGSIVFVIIGFVGFVPHSLGQQIIAISFDKEKQAFYKLPITFKD